MFKGSKQNENGNEIENENDNDNDNKNEETYKKKQVARGVYEGSGDG